MATYKGGKGQRRGDYHKRDGWPTHRDYKPGSSSPGPRRSNSPWRNHRPDIHREPKDSQRTYVLFLAEEWKKVEQDLTKESKDIKSTVEYVEKMPTDIKAQEMFDMEHYLKNREKPATPD